jgi:hypothetical protein
MICFRGWLFPGSGFQMYLTVFTRSGSTRREFLTPMKVRGGKSYENISAYCEM